MEPETPELPAKPQTPLTVEQQARRRTIKAFAWFGAASLLPFGVWKLIKSQPRAGGIPQSLRNVLDRNGQLANTYFSNAKLAPTFPRSMAAKRVRVNGRDGLKTPLNKEAWRLEINQPGVSPLALTLEDIKAFPKHEIVFEFKCIEGWSQIQHWGGTRFSDFVRRYNLGTRNGKDAQHDTDWFDYVGMQTPDRQYYVGIDMRSALHPQTLLCYEMNGKPLDDAHGAPLRLIIPVKYGVKNLKRIGTISFSDQRPRDFWAERGYDYHIGL